MIQLLKINPDNPRVISKKDFEKLKKSLKEFPKMLELRPIVYDDNYVVLGGNMRLKALRELVKDGFEVKEEYFINASELTEAQKREFVIKDNINIGEWDYDLLSSDWDDLPLEEWGLAIQLDDDYTHFSFKFDRQFVYRDRKIKNLDKVFEIMLNFYKSVDCLSLAMAQNGDFIGGKKGGFGKSIRLRRKCMNSFICSTNRPFKFIGRINEDVNTYTNLGSRSKPFFTINNVSLNQTNTQKNKGGMTETYLDSGTYVKSFYSIMYSPSSVKIAEMGDKHRRIHHRVDWEVAVPKIIREDI